MKKNMNLALPFAFMCIGAGSMMYSYVKMHPKKAKVIKQDIKNAVKDLK